jgi:hypothetical protein
MIDLTKLANKLDEALIKETTETLTKFLNDKRMTNNKQTSIDWFFDQLVLNRIIIINGTTYWDKVKTKYEILLQQAKEMYQDEIEAAIIKNCATESTSAAHESSVFRNHIIAAFDQGVIAEFTHQVSGAPETSGQEYFNQTYGDGVEIVGKEMSYDDGYKQGYNRAIELTKWAISNLIPPSDGVQ